MRRKQDYIDMLGGSIVLNWYTLPELKALHKLKNSGEDISSYLEEYNPFDKVSYKIKTYLKESGLPFDKEVPLFIYEYLQSKSYPVEFYKIDLRKLKTPKECMNCLEWLTHGIPVNHVIDFRRVKYSKDIGELIDSMDYADYRDYLKYGESFVRECMYVLAGRYDIDNLYRSKNLTDNGDTTHYSLVQSLNDYDYRQKFKTALRYISVNYHHLEEIKTYLEYVYTRFNGKMSEVNKYVKADAQDLTESWHIDRYVKSQLAGFDPVFYRNLGISGKEFRNISNAFYEKYCEEEKGGTASVKDR